jgi:hypothetical protein
MITHALKWFLHEYLIKIDQAYELSKGIYLITYVHVTKDEYIIISFKN